MAAGIGRRADAEPIVAVQTLSFVTVRGHFFRAVRVGSEAIALHGSRAAGRFSRPGEAALYLSASRDGVAAAMQRYGGLEDRSILSVRVDERQVVDLRDARACHALGVEAADAAIDWHAALSAGETPASWRVSDRLRKVGARGVIDPSRTVPGLWHLALFVWDGARIEGTGR